MAKDHVKLEIVNENHKNSDPRYDEEIEMIFDKPAKTLAKNQVTNNVHLNNNGRGYDKHYKYYSMVTSQNIELFYMYVLWLGWEDCITIDSAQSNNNNFGESDSEHLSPSLPLLEPDRGRQLPPLAGPEIDDIDGDPPKDAAPFPGIDDGLLDTDDKKPEAHDHESDDHHPELAPDDKHLEPHDEGVVPDGKLPWEHDEPDYPYDVNGLSTRFGDSRPVSPMSGVIPDVNTYQQKKNLAQGMMDLALLSANANQLRYVIESSATHPYYYPSLVFISLSIIIQVMVGIGLIMNSRYDVNDHKERCKADKINNMTVLGVFLITIVNVFITSFSVATQNVTPNGVAVQQAG